MPPKGSKRKTSTSGSAAPNIKKQKSSAIENELTQFMQSTLGLINELKEGTEYLNGFFVKLPPKKHYPDYYVLIENPISLHEIKSKVDSKKYAHVNDFLSDFDLMRTNASTYNERDSVVTVNANKILDFVKDQVEQFVNAQPVEEATEVQEEEPEPVKEEEEDTKLQAPKKTATPKIKIKLSQNTSKARTTNATLEMSPLKTKLLSVLQEIIDYEDNGIPISEPFLEEVDPEEVPDYHKIVKNPVALNTVKRGVLSGRYKNVDQFASHLRLIWKNAQSYNPETELLYQDSLTLENFSNEKIKQLKEELKAESDKLPPKEAESTAAVADETPETAPAQEELQEAPKETVVVETPVKRKGRPPKSKSKTSIKTETRKSTDDLSSLEILHSDSAKDTTITITKQNIDDAKLDQEIAEIEAELPPLEDFNDAETTIAKEDKSISPDYQTEIQKLRSTLNSNRRPVQDATTTKLVEQISITSSRSVYRQTIKQATQPLFQSWFEYKFNAKSNTPLNHFTFTLPQHQGSISFLAGLNNNLLERKFLTTLTVNGERVNAIPSIQYSDSTENLSSRYELKLATGLNKVNFKITLDKIKDEEASTRLRNSTPKDYNALNNGLENEASNADIEAVEGLSFWIQVI